MNYMSYLWKRNKTRRLKASIVVEVILILVVLIALVAIFKTQLTELVGDIFDKITREGLKI